MCASRVPSVEPPQLNRENRRLKAVHSIIVPDLIVEVPLALGVIAQGAGAPRDRHIIGNQSSAFTVCSQILAGIKTEASNFSQLANSLAPIACSMCLRGILNNGYSIFISNCVDAVHIRRHAIEVYRNYSLGARCDSSFKLGWAHG